MSKNRWQKVFLADVAKIDTGYAFKGALYSPEGNLKVIRGKNVTEARCRWGSDAKFWNHNIEKLKKYLLKKNDIVIGMDGSKIGKNKSLVKDADLPSILAQRVGRVRANSLSCQGFLWQIINSNSFLRYIDLVKTGTSIPHMSLTQIGAFEINLPPLPIQKAIAKILGDLDVKIELNSKMNENLEAMAQALFQSWFVDFDPVLDNFLANNDNNVQALPEPLRKKGAIRLEVFKKNTPEVNALFPNNFVFNEELEKWIPKGWVLEAAGNVCNISIGKTPPRKQQESFEKEPNCENKTWVSIKNMGSCGVYIDNSDECLTNESINKFNVKIVPKGTVILSFKMTVGRVAITSKELCTNEAIAHFISPKFNVSEMYLYNYLREFNYDILGSTSSIVTAVNSKIIKGMPILLPTKEILQHFDISIKSIFDQIYSISKQTQSLTKLRDTLLPKLISGKLEVPEAMMEIEKEINNKL